MKRFDFLCVVGVNPGRRRPIVMNEAMQQRSTTTAVSGSSRLDGSLKPQELSELEAPRSISSLVQSILGDVWH